MNPLRSLIPAFALALGFAAPPAFAAGPPVAVAVVSADRVEFHPTVPFDRIELSVATPGGEVVAKSYGRGESISFTRLAESGSARPDGEYVWQVVVGPVLDAATRKRMAEARETGKDAELIAELVASGRIPARPQVAGGSLRLLGGSFVTPGGIEPGSPSPEGSAPAATPGKGAGTNSGGATPQDQVIADDLIVLQSLCVGFDCANGEVFDTDTIRVKENNTRIKFDDTSASAGFPANDWQLLANERYSGELNKFSIEDVSAGATPFTIRAGADSNSIYLDTEGRLGLRTSTPVLDIHTSTGNTPALRLEQTNAVGFTAQTWDIGANEANFFVRDVTGGSRLSFRIRPGAPTSSLDISADGDIGVATASPNARLDIAVAPSQSEPVIRASINPDDPLTIVELLSLSVAGNLTIAGVLTQGSSCAIKEGFEPVSGGDVLDRLAAVPVTTWTYRNDATGTRHAGPMAEDFRAAFGLGADERHVAPSDVTGIALAAIQELERRNRALAEEKARLEGRVDELERVIRRIDDRLAGGGDGTGR